MRDRVVRHAGFDRAIHWLIAVCVLILLATAFLPILGIDFAWVTIHWSVGLILIVAVVAHIFKALFTKRLRRIWISRRDLADAFRIARINLRLERGSVPRPGKFSFAQKLIHLAFSIVIVAAGVTGAVMTVKMDTPWWDANAYWLSDETWGLVYVIHGFSALVLITMVMTHVYFAVRPEKLPYFRAMIRGWMSRGEFESMHDPQRWKVEK
jgi:formate dehydrogenase subunit gamma